MSRRSIVVRLTYPGSDWGDDFVEFTFFNDLTPLNVHKALQSQSEALSISDFPSAQDYADAVCDGTADALGATWHYVFPDVTFDVTDQNRPVEC